MSNVSLIDGHIDDEPITDEQIIKAFELCINLDLDNCPTCCYFDSSEENEWCSEKLFASVLDLLNRQKAENAELQLKINELEIELKAMRGAANSYKAEVESSQMAFDTMKRWAKEAEVRATKEVAKKLKEFVKEMVGE